MPEDQRMWRLRASSRALVCAEGIPNSAVLLLLRSLTAVGAAWDPGLQGAMEAAGTAIYEERGLEALLTDLAGS
ncbi:MAG TPA: DUF2399 domain-containing protein [Acidimicrobiales bacterium]|nr:DUF2399 domain-containing protein [Acidimicrobiales bacterium]